jgi:hypothetical protein
MLYSSFVRIMGIYSLEIYLSHTMQRGDANSDAALVRRFLVVCANRRGNRGKNLYPDASGSIDTRPQRESETTASRYRAQSWQSGSSDVASGLWSILDRSPDPVSGRWGRPHHQRRRPR